MEGVETKAQLDLLVAENTFDEAQGFLFSPAVSARDIAALLDPATMLDLFKKAGSRKVA